MLHVASEFESICKAKMECFHALGTSDLQEVESRTRTFMCREVRHLALSCGIASSNDMAPNAFESD